MATVRQRKCSHRVWNQSAAGQDRNERGRAFLFPGIYFGCPELPGAARLNVTTSREEAGERALSPGVIQLLLLLNSKERARSRESSLSPRSRSGSCCPKLRIRELGLCSPAAGVALGAAPSPGGGREAGDLHPSPSLQLRVHLGMDSGPQHGGHAHLLLEEREGETENTNTKELVRDEEVWVSPASYHSTARGHGDSSAAIWRLLCWAIPLFFSR